MRPAVLCVALTACTALNPAFDQPGPSTSAGETSPSTTSPGESTQPVDPTTSSTSSLSMTQSGTSGPGDSSTSATSEPASTSDSSAGPLCAAQNEACDLLACCGECATCTNGTCVLDDALCGTCGVCVAGSCEPAKQNTPCVPDQDDCPNRVWGLVNGVCYATKPAGLCDKDGGCIPDCQDQGAVIAMCDPRCVIAGLCTSGDDPDEITVDTLCHHEGAPAGECIPTCNQEGTVVVANACDAAGMCVKIDEFSCEPYVCTGPGQCTNNCMSPEDCAPMHTCIGNVCT